MNQIDQDIKNQEFHSLYLLYGPEDYLRRFYRDRLKRAILPEDGEINLNTFRGKEIDVRELAQQAQTLPFFAPRRLIIVEESGLFKGADSYLADQIDQFPEETILIFSEEQVDVRSRLYKKLREKACIMECKYLTEADMTGWLLRRLQKEGKKIQRSAMERFLACIGSDMQGAVNELEKLICYTGEREGITLEDVEAVCALRLEDRIFDLIDAIVLQKKKEAMKQYHDLLGLRESPVRILSLLSSHWLRLMQIRDLRDQGFDKNEIVSRSGLKEFVVRKGLGQCERLSQKMIFEAARLCLNAEESFKKGKMSDQMAVELAITQMLCLPRNRK